MPYKDYEKHKQNARENYYKNREKKKRQVMLYYYEHFEERNRQKKEWAQKNKEKLREYRRKYFAKYRIEQRLKAKAHWTLHNAIRYGKIKRENICENCDKDGLLDAHHFDYNKPLEVQWLCHQCHLVKHRKVS